MLKVGVREFTKNFNKYQNMEMVEIIDKKTDEIKGVFISPKAAEKVKDLLSKSKKEKIEGILKFAGTMEVDEKFKDLTKEELRLEIAKLKNG
jgi:23S rRNA pseudoU1915 N3-methylase RlmH